MKRLLAGLVLGVLGFWAAPALAAAPPPAPVARTAVKTGHADVLAGRFADGKLTMKSTIGPAATATDYDPANVVFHVTDDHTIIADEAKGYEFIGALGTKFWWAPAATATGAPQLGWSFDKLPAANFDPTGKMTIKLVSLTGPGRLEVFTVTGDTGAGGTLNRLLSSDPDMDLESYKSAEVGKPLDPNWVFTKEGRYRVVFEVSGVDKVTNTVVTAPKVEVDFIVGAPAADATSTALTATPVVAPKAGEEVTLVATVTPAAARGYAEFFDGTTSLGNAELVNGIATFKTEALTAGTKSLTAKFHPKYTDDLATSTSTALSYEVKPGASATPSSTHVPLDPTAAASPKTCTVITDGHYDYTATLDDDDKLQSMVKDAAGNLKEPGSVAVRVTPTVQIPAGQSFLGTAGTTVWQLPQTQTTGVPFLGWSAESLTKPVTWTLDKVTGPGKVALFTTGTGTTPTVLFNGTDSTTVAAGAHVHGTWAFTKEGVYRVKFTQKTTLDGGATTSDTESLIFMVGNEGNTPVCDPGSGNLALTGGGPLLLFASIGTMLFSAGAVFLFFTRRSLGLF